MSFAEHRVRTHFLLIAPAMLLPAVPRAYGEIRQVPQATEQVGMSRMEVIVRGPWGSAPGHFGKVDEASRPGPMDFAITQDALYVLDPVNTRVQVFDLDGDFRREIAIGTRTADFMCVDAGGNVAVLDAFARREFKMFSVSGELLVHAGVPASIGLPSAILADGDRIWIEERHNRVHEVSLEPGKRRAPAQIVTSLTGRPLGRSHGTLHARKEGADKVIIRTGTPQETGKSVTLRFPRRVTSIVTLESDDSGQIYVAAACPRDPGADQWKADIMLVVIGPDGRIAGAMCMPDAYVTDHYRKLGVSRSGDIIQMQTTEDQVRFVRCVLRPHTSERRSR